MNAFQTIIGTLKPTQQQTAGTGTDSNSQQDSSWLLTSAARAVGSLAGAVSIIFGLFLMLDIFSVKCIFGGALLVLEGFLMLLTEAPCCCVFFEFAYMPSTLLNNRPPWIKATIYLFFAVIPFMWCTGLSTFLACGLTMATSALYLLMALGKKANREEMLAKSAQQQQTTSNNVPRNISTAPTSVLVQNEELPMPTTVPTTKPGFNNQVLY